jgi:predicted RNA-binding Zn-ribbon protein involved in translation (DUF1610 family)
MSSPYIPQKPIQSETKSAYVPPYVGGDEITCPNCGALMQRAGSCYCCPECGTTSGCS